MTNNLIENKTNVFYTVELNESVGVKESHFYSGEVKKVEVTREKEYFYKYNTLGGAEKVAEFVGGKVIKRTWTTVVTEITEEIKGDN